MSVARREKRRRMTEIFIDIVYWILLIAAIVLVLSLLVIGLKILTELWGDLLRIGFRQWWRNL
jgi:hypothetical protein